MNLVEKLIRIDKEKANEKETKKIKSRKLSRLLGEDTEITIQELSGKRFNDLIAMCVDKNGKKDWHKINDMNLMFCVEGIIEPSMKDASLMEHFGAKTPKDLVEILFDAESASISDEISALSGFTKDAEEEVKN